MWNHVIAGQDKKALVPRKMDWESWGELSLFDQTEFIDVRFGLEGSSMDTSGYVYVPNACKEKDAACKVHVSIHGCHQGR